MVPASSKYKLRIPVEDAILKGEGTLLGEVTGQKEATQHRDGNPTPMAPKTYKESRRETDSSLTARAQRQRRRVQIVEAAQNMAVKMPPATTASPQISSLRTRPDGSKTKSKVSLHRQSTGQKSDRLVPNNTKKSSPRLSDGDRERTGENVPRRAVERRSDTGSSVVSMKTASSESRASGEICFDVTGQMRSTSFQGGPAFTTSLRNLKQGTSLPTVKPKCLARRRSEPTIPTTLALISSEILPLQAPSRHPSMGPAHHTCWGVKTCPEPTPVLVTPDHVANCTPGLDPKSTGVRNQRRVRTKLENEDGVDLPGDEHENEEEDDSRTLDQRVMTWLDGLDSATCRRFMRRQMAALQEIDDVE